MSFAEGYIEVADRIRLFKELYPEGSLQAEIVEILDNRVIVKAYAYRSPDDNRPGVGLAWEEVPGKTPYTRGSELMNCETSAWGRAIAALGIGTKKVASADEVKFAQARQAVSEPFPNAPLEEQEIGTNCLHGAMVWRTGVSKSTGKPWAAWMCQAPDKDDQCKPLFSKVES